MQAYFTIIVCPIVKLSLLRLFKFLIASMVTPYSFEMEYKVSPVFTICLMALGCSDVYFPF